MCNCDDLVRPDRRRRRSQFRNVDATMNVEVTVLLFAKAREIVGKKQEKLVLPNTLTYAELFDRIVEEFSLQSIKDSLILAVNEEFCTEDSFELRSGDEIAVIPPLSGG